MAGAASAISRVGMARGKEEGGRADRKVAVGQVHLAPRDGIRPGLRERERASPAGVGRGLDPVLAVVGRVPVPVPVELEICLPLR